MNKFILTIQIGVIISITNMFSQPEPITIQFVEAQPLWEHLVCDTAFYEIGSQPDINKYTVVDPHIAKRFGDNLLILNRAINYNGQSFGYILEKLNIFNGSIEWQQYNTYYNGGLQDLYKDIYHRPDGSFEMIGVTRHGAYSDLFAAWDVGVNSSNFIRKIVDTNYGHITEEILSDDTTEYVPISLNHFPLIQDSLYLATVVDGWEEDGQSVYGNLFFLLDGNQNIIGKSPVARIKFETSDTSLQPLSYGQPTLVARISDDQFVCWLYKDKFYPAETESQLIWVNVEDLNNIYVERRLNIENLIPDRDDLYKYISFNSENGYTFLSKPYYNQVLDKTIMYLLAFDQSGNLALNFRELHFNDHYYQNGLQIYATEDEIYYAAYPSISGRKGIDFLRFVPGTSNVEYISSLTSAFEDEEFARQLEVCKLYDDNLLLIGAYTKKLGEEQNSAVKYYAFDARDLGIQLSTSTPFNNTVCRIKLFPTITSGCFTVQDIPSGMGDISVRINDMQGMGIFMTQLQGDGLVCIDSQLPHGVYLVSLFRRDNKLLGSYKLIIE